MQTLGRRAALGGIAAGLAAPALAPALAQAPAWPSGPVRIVVPFPPGGSTDAVARLAAPGLQAALGVPIVIENRGGAAGSIGTGIVARAEPDGNTWLLTFDSHAVLEALLPQLNFSPSRDLVPVMHIGGAPYVLGTKPDKPFKTIGDVVAAAKASPESVSFGSTGNGTVGHLAMTLFSQRAGARLTHIAYRGGGPAVTDAVAGNIDLIIGSAAVLNPQFSGGRLRPVVQMGTARLPGLPDTPTMQQSGFDGFVAEAWWAVFAPTGTPAPIRARFHEALVKAFSDPNVVETMTNAQQARLVRASQEDTARFIAREVETWGKVVRDNAIKAD
ncbi:MAG: tripartite tricarboxylate transporter substrate-binding protein [Acetobacteraceae bacterium]|jgi:tripartite-type tricarboxylate transporter receptor subunit TctC|nr:tripartite tricarboxylate transporter substrate-binding protein [Acetobacteraceae bacterium]